MKKPSRFTQAAIDRALDHGSVTISWLRYHIAENTTHCTQQSVFGSAGNAGRIISQLVKQGVLKEVVLPNVENSGLYVFANKQKAP